MSSDNFEHQLNRTLIDHNLQQQFKKSKALKESVISHCDNSKWSIMNQASFTQTFTFQFVATFLFTYGYTCSLSNFQVDAQAAGCLFMAICFTGPFCGANINPVITVSNYIKKQNQYKAHKLFWYLSAQLSAAALALAWSQFLGHPKLNELILQDPYDIFKVLTNQTMGVFILVLFLLLLSNPNTTFIQSQLSGYLSIAIFYHIARSFAPLAGLVINPAITIIVAIQYAIQGNASSLKNCWAWLLGDIIGCIAATMFYDHLYEPIIKQLREIRRKSQNFESITDEQDLSNKSMLGN